MEVIVTRDGGWLQRLLYFAMIILGVYIVQKGGALLAETGSARAILDAGMLQQRLEDAAARTWTPGYAAAVEERKPVNWFAAWMRPLVPTYSYLAERADEEQTAEASEEPGSAWHTASRSTEASDIPAQASEADANPGSAVPTASEGESEDAADAKSRTRAAIPHETSADGQAQSERSVQEEDEPSLPKSSDSSQPVFGRNVSAELLEQLSDFNYLLNEYFIVDPGTCADADLLDAAALLSEDLSIVKNPEVPQILIYHTHSQEAFADSDPDDPGTTIVGMGDYLTELLTGYGYQVIHDTGVYDLVDGVLDRSTAYDYARAQVQQILEEHPSIEVIIDLHRDGVDGEKFVTEIDGRPTSKIMFFNGISRNSADELIAYLPNSYTQQNLAFSLQLELKARRQYPDFTRNIYLKAERFNLHLRPRSLLIEAGTQLNTVEEERNAMIPLADLIDQVLSGRE